MANGHGGPLLGSRPYRLTAVLSRAARSHAAWPRLMYRVDGELPRTQPSRLTAVSAHGHTLPRCSGSLLAPALALAPRAAAAAPPAVSSPSAGAHAGVLVSAHATAAGLLRMVDTITMATLSAIVARNTAIIAMPLALAARSRRIARIPLWLLPYG